MCAPVKFRQHIEKVWRMPPDSHSRLNKVRLDKNERIEIFPTEFWQELVKEVSQESVLAYPETSPLYDQLAQHHRLAPENFLLTAGSDAAIRHCFEAFVAPGDKVVYPHPTFAMVAIYCDLFGAEKAPIGYDGSLSLDTVKMLSEIDENTALVVLANPNSPTGTAVTDQFIRQLLNKAATLKVPVMIDEAYHGFCSVTAEPLLAEFENLIVTRSFSKVAGLAGLRIGYVMANPEVIGLLTRFRPMYEVNSFGVLFSRKVLSSWDMVLDYGQRTGKGRDRLAQELKNLGLAVVDTETNFIHVDLGAAKDTVLNALGENGVLVRGMLSVPGYENFTRLSVGPWEVMVPILATIIKVLATETSLKE